MISVTHNLNTQKEKSMFSIQVAKFETLKEKSLQNFVRCFATTGMTYYSYISSLCVTVVYSVINMVSYSATI